MAAGDAVGGNAGHHVAEDQRPVLRPHGHPHGLPGLDAQIGGVLRREMQMPLGHDHALLQLHFAAGAYQHARAGARKIASYADGCADAQRGGVGHGKLHLRPLPQGGDDGDAHRAAGADDGELLGADRLTELGQRLSRRQRIAVAEQKLQMLLTQVNVMGGDLDGDVHKRPPRRDKIIKNIAHSRQGCNSF